MTIDNVNVDHHTFHTVFLSRINQHLLIFLLYSFTKNEKAYWRKGYRASTIQQFRK
jgi:hypothetical protein